MIIKKLRLKNFKVFEDANFEFKEGINILSGMHGSGLTILSAIKWCLDIENDWHYVKRRDLLLNIQAFHRLEKEKTSEEETMEAHLFFEIDGKKIEIIKTNIYEFNGAVVLKEKNTKVLVDETMQKLNKTEVEKFIKEIIPSELIDVCFISEACEEKSFNNIVKIVYNDNKEFIESFNNFSKKHSFKNKYGHFLQINENLQPYWADSQNYFGTCERVLLSVFSSIICKNIIENKLNLKHSLAIFLDNAFSMLSFDMHEYILQIIQKHLKQSVVVCEHCKVSKTNYHKIKLS